MTGHGEDEEGRSQGVANGSEGRGGVRVSKAGAREMGSSNPEVAGGWRSQSSSDPKTLEC